MKNHQFSKRRVFIIPLLLQNEQHRPLKIFKKPQQKKQKRKNSRIPSCSQNEQYQSSIHLSQFPRKEWNKLKQIQKKYPSLSKNANQETDFPWCTPANIGRLEGCSPYFESTRRRSSIEYLAVCQSA